MIHVLPKPLPACVVCGRPVTANGPALTIGSQTRLPPTCSTKCRNDYQVEPERYRKAGAA